MEYHWGVQPQVECFNPRGGKVASRGKDTCSERLTVEIHMWGSPRGGIMHMEAPRGTYEVRAKRKDFEELIREMEEREAERERDAIEREERRWREMEEKEERKERERREHQKRLEQEARERVEKRDREIQVLRMAEVQGSPVPVLDLSIRRRFVRRSYCAAGPNQVWHVDGYDKLKPFGIAISGCIDGYSRRVMWLSSGSTNNDPAVIAHHYL
ncbi:unnamed protein product [Leuciscus chuanchicus]